MEEDSVVFEATGLGDYLRAGGLDEEVEEVIVEEQEPEVAHPVLSKWSRIHKWLASLYRSWRSPRAIKKLKTLLIQRIIKAGVIEEAAIMAFIEEKGFELEVPETNISWSVMKRIMGESLIAIVPAATAIVAQKSSFKTSIIALVPTVALLLRWGSLMPLLCEYSKLDRYLEASKLFDEELRIAAGTLIEESLIRTHPNINMRGCASARLPESEDMVEVSDLSSLPGIRIALIKTTSRLALQFSRELQLQRRRNPLPYQMDQSVLGLPDIDESDEAEKNEVPSIATIRVAISKFYLREEEFVKRLVVDLLSSEDDPNRVFIDDELFILLISCVQQLKTSLGTH